MPAALLVLLLATAATARLGDLARLDHGDVFTLIGDVCDARACSEHGAGARPNDDLTADGCTCACPQRAPLFREDRELCVDDLSECSLATFGTGTGMQRIPFVFLPLKGQIIHPSRDITFQDVKTPICAVSGAQYLTRKGFIDLRNTLDADVPFSLFRDEGKTFLQWSGEDELRVRMSGRVMVVRLLCRDVAAPPASPLDLRGVFTPCVAFRVQGSPPKFSNNVTEVQFTPNAQTSEVSMTSGLTVTEYVAIGISSLLLGLIYVASVFLYLHIRKRRKAASEEKSSRRLKTLKNGNPITERDIVRINDRVQTLVNAIDEDDVVVKKNPLLVIRGQFHEMKNNFTCESRSNLSDFEDFSEHSDQNNQVTALVHPHDEEINFRNQFIEQNHREESNIERLPDEHVSIVETTDDKEINRPVGTTRRKLYFNPAYFEPHLMAEPPAAALEFLTKIREVITIAKSKMESKRFQPVLHEIPEEDIYLPNGSGSVEFHRGLGSQRSGSLMSLKRENSRKKINCVGCPGCKLNENIDMSSHINFNATICSNCISHKGEKQNSIRKWLENIPVEQNTLFNATTPKQSNSLLRSNMSKKNSFSECNPTYLTDDVSPVKKYSTTSVKSEPSIRNYNLPSSELQRVHCMQRDRINFCHTISTVDDISPIKPNENLRISSHNSVNTQKKKNTIKSMLPDMINEAIALDHCSKSCSQSSSDDEILNRNSTATDINSLKRNDSESPTGMDYETDSLERGSNKKNMTTLEYYDLTSSQASPALSSALPLEEELTMRNAIYKTNPHSENNTPSPQGGIKNHYETIGKKKIIQQENQNISHPGDYSLVSEVYVNNNYNFGSTPTSPSGSECSIGSRKLMQSSNTILKEAPGSLTIEVKDPAENYIKIHESDDFEPDTLDRKHAKYKDVLDCMQFSRNNLLKNIDQNLQHDNILGLRSSGSFKKTNDNLQNTTKFNSLRNKSDQKVLQSRSKLSPTMFSTPENLKKLSFDTWCEDPDWSTEESRTLTLELRHSKRQRQSTPPVKKQYINLPRPDILPPLPPIDDNPIYEQPTSPPRRVESIEITGDMNQKNVNDRSLSPRTFTKNISPDNFGMITRPSSDAMRASVYSHSSDSGHKVYNFRHKINDSFKISGRRRRSNSYADGGLNTNTFTKIQKENINNCKTRFRRKKGLSIEDSGYLSSDSASSKKLLRKLVIAKIASCSESDDTENEARSESGAESVETHSVYFGSFRKPQPISVENDSRSKYH